MHCNRDIIIIEMIRILLSKLLALRKICLDTSYNSSQNYSVTYKELLFEQILKNLNIYNIYYTSNFG